MELQALILSLLLLTLVYDTESRSLDTREKCATECEDSNNNAFALNSINKFTYQATVESSFQTEPDANSLTKLQIISTVLIDPINPCELVLRLEDTSLTSDEVTTSESLRIWTESLEQNPLHFNWQRGKIPNICASNDDPKWVLNIKRGILSTLQVSSFTTAKEIVETDVTGKCQSSYTVEGDHALKNVTKIKDYSTCENRNENLLFSYFKLYQADSPRQNFIYSSQTCKQRFEDMKLRSSSCEERHTFRPFSDSESGAQTFIDQTLTFEELLSTSQRERPTLSTFRRSTLEFESEDDASGSWTVSAEVQNVSRYLCLKMETENFIEIGKDFVKLVSLIRRIDPDELLQTYNILYGICPERENAFRQMLQDALLWCESEGCVVLKASLIANNNDPETTDLHKQWLAGMNFITKPTSVMLTAVMEIVQNDMYMESSYLIAGTMIHRLCELDQNCLSDTAVRRALSFFEDKLGVNCRTSSESAKQEILFALRAIGNAGRTNSIGTVGICAQEDSNDMETRIAAIQTFRRMPCSTYDRSAIDRLFFDITQDSEIRIASYLSLMKCPKPRLVQNLIALLDTEPVQQVASFVSSNLREIMESNDPLKGYMKPLLLETDFAKKHDLDPRKFSRYYETSIFSEKLNAGASVESSIIWSPKSFVPRSAELGLSVDLFGQAVNLFEVGGRAEGVEALVQKMLGSDNILKNNPLGKLFMGSDDDNDDDDDDDDDDDVEDDEPVEIQTDSSENHDVERYRDRFQSKLNTEDQPNYNYYLRLFGNEIMYGNLRSMKKDPALTRESIIGQLFKDGHYEYHKNVLFLNSIHTLPTGVGFPLSIAFNGSSNVDVNVNGSMNMQSMFESPPSLHLRGMLEPRATVIVSGTMTIDAHVTKIGIATESSALTAMKVDAEARLRRGQKLKIDINTPYQKTTQFTFNHKLLKVVGEELEVIGDPQTNNEPNCSSPFAGQRICVEKTRAKQNQNLLSFYKEEQGKVESEDLSSLFTFKDSQSLHHVRCYYVNSFLHFDGYSVTNLAIFPLDGPISVSAYLQKTNSAITGYTLKGSYENERFPNAFQANLTMKANGANQQIGFNFTYDLENKIFDMELKGLQTNLSLSGNMENDPRGNVLTLTYQKNGQESSLQTTYSKSTDGRARSWQANTVLSTPTKTITARAQANLDPQRSVTAGLVVENYFDIPVELNINLNDESESNRKRYEGEGRMVIPGIINTDGSFNLRLLPSSDNFRFMLDYSFNQMKNQRVLFFHKRRNQPTDHKTQWSVDQKLTVTQNPNFDHRLYLKYSSDRQSVVSSVKFDYKDVNYISVNQSFSYKFARSHKQMQGNFTVEVPPSQILYTGGFGYLHNDTTLHTNVSVKNYVINLLWQDRATSNLLHKSLDLEFPTPWGPLHLNNRIEEERNKVYTLTGDYRLGSSDGLGIRTTCTVENLNLQKSVSVIVQGDSDQELLNGHSILQWYDSNGFAFSNSIRSKYNELTVLNLRYVTDGRREYEVLFQHDPNVYFHGNATLENNHLFIGFKFNDDTIERRFLQLNAMKSFTGSLSNLTVSFATNFPPIPFDSLAVSGQLLTADTGTTKAGVWYKLDEIEVIGIDTSFVQGQPGGTYSFVFEGRHTLCSRYNLIKFNISTSSYYSARSALVVDRAEIFSANFTVNVERITVDGNISHNILALPLPSPISVHAEYGHDHVNISLTYNKEDEPNELLLPSIEATLRWGDQFRNSGIGISLDLILDGKKFYSELSYSNENEEERSVKFTAKEVLTDFVLVEARMFFCHNSFNVSTGVDFIMHGDTKLYILFDWNKNGFSFQASHSYSLFEPKSVRAKFNSELTTAYDYELAEYNLNLQVDTDSLDVSLEQKKPGGVIFVIDTVGTFFGHNAGKIVVEVSTNENLLLSVTSSSLGEIRVAVDIEIDSEEALLGVSINNNARSLLGNDYPRNIEFKVGIGYSFEEQIKLRFNGTFIKDDRAYNVYALHSGKYNEAPYQCNTTIGHNIPEFDSFKVPREVSINNTLNYELQGIEVSLASVVGQTVYNQELDRLDRLINSTNASIHVMGLQNRVIFSILHDFNVPKGVPHQAQFDISVSCPPIASGILFRSLNLGLERDYVRNTASVTLTKTRWDSVMFVFQHNATELYNYGLAKDMSITISRRSFDFDVVIIYDTLKKSIGFNVDYHGLGDLKVLFTHNFTLEKYNIPKKLGFDYELEVVGNKVEFILSTYFGKNVSHAHVDFKSLSEPFDIVYHHEQNFTDPQLFPNNLVIRINQNFDPTIFSAEMNIIYETNNIMRMAIEKPNSEAFSFESTITQTFSNAIPRTVGLNLRVSANHEMTVRLNPDFLTFSVTPDPTNKSLYISLNQAISKNVPYVWAEIIPSELQIETHYNLSKTKQKESFLVNSTIRTNEDSERKVMTLMGSFVRPDWNMMFVDISFYHRFRNLENVIPFSGRFNALYDIGESSLTVQANATLDNQIFNHLLKLDYELEDDDEKSVGINIEIENQGLRSMGIPSLINGTISLERGDTLGAALWGGYDDNAVDIQLEVDTANRRLDIDFFHTWTFVFNTLNFTIDLPRYGNMSINITIDEVSLAIPQNLNLVGHMDSQAVEINFQHTFEQFSPRRVVISGSYRIVPSLFVNLTTQIDEKIYRFEGGFQKLDDGFRITTLLPDDLLRSISIVGGLRPGGISLTMEQSIPEISEIIPQYLGVAGNISSTSPLNLTASLRRGSDSPVFSTSLDTSGMRFSLSHDFEIRYLPKSIVVELFNTSAPPTYGISVNINGIKRKVSASIDANNREVGFSHSIPELDQWFVARDVVIALKANPDTMGGEIYISIDGIEHRVGGSINRRRRLLNFFTNNIPTSLAQNVPRNVTLSVKGSLFPLDGTVSLTIDEIERSVDARLQRNTRAVSSLFKFRIPELKGYLPRHVAVSAEFDSTSGQLDFSFNKDERNQTFFAKFNLAENFHFEANHSLVLLKKYPSALDVNINWNIEDLYGKVNVTVNKKFEYVLNGNFIFNDNGWYGVNLQGSHNFKKLSRKYDIPLSTQLSFRGKVENYAFRGETVIYLLNDHLYNATAEVRLTWLESRKAVAASYFHFYREMTRSVSGFLTFENESDGKSLEFFGEQTLPEAGHVRFRLSGSMININRLVLNSTASHNLTELSKFEIPTTITGSIVTTVNLEELTANTQSLFVYGELHTTANVKISGRNNNIKIGFEVDSNLFNTNYQFNASANCKGRGTACEIAYHLVSQTKADRIALSFSAEPSTLMVDISIYQPTLNELGFPQTTTFTVNSINDGINKHWEFNLTIDGQPCTVSIDFEFQKGDATHPSRLSIGTTFDSSISYFNTMQLPKHAAINLSSLIDNAEAIERLAIEYNKDYLQLNMTSYLDPTYLNESLTFATNSAYLSEMLGFSRLEEVYTNVINGNDNVINGGVTKDDETVFDYHFDRNLLTKEVNCSFTILEYAAVLNETNTAEKKRFLLEITKSKGTLFKIDVEYNNTDKKGEIEIESHINEVDFKLQGNGSKTATNATAHLSVSMNEDYLLEVDLKPIREKSLVGQKLVIQRRSGAKNGNASFKYAFDKNLDSGLIEYSSFAKENVVVRFFYNQTAAYFTVTCQNMELDYELLSDGDEFTNFSQALRYRNVPYFERIGIPQNIATVYERNDFKNLTITVEGDQQVLFDLFVSSSKFNLTANKPDGVSVLKIRAALHPKKSIRSSWKIGKYDGKLDVIVGMFNARRGNTSITIKLVNNFDQFSLDAYASPTNNFEPADFIAVLRTSSNFSSPRFNIELKANSSEDISRYVGDFEATYNNNTFKIQVDCQPDNWQLNVTQPWFKSAPDTNLAYSLSTDSDGKKVYLAKLQWGNKDEKQIMMVETTAKENGASWFYSAHLKQPFEVLYITNLFVDAYVNVIQSNTYHFGVDSALNENENNFDSIYRGSLPQLLGSHRLDVTIIQSITSFIPSEFNTFGNVTISSNEYSSNWTINSPSGQEFAHLQKNIAYNEDGWLMAFLWKQNYYDMPFSYMNMSMAFNQQEGGTAALKIDSYRPLLVMFSYQVPLSINHDDNCSISVYAQSGPLSKWLMFRTFDLRAWFNTDIHERSHNRTVNLELNLDNSVHMFRGESYFINSNRVGNRFNGKIQVRHPYDLRLLGNSLPKDMELLAVLVHRNRIRLTLTYNDERLTEPYNVEIQTKANDDGVLFGAKVLAYTASRENNRMTVAVSLTSSSVTGMWIFPNKNINMECVLSYSNSETNFKTEAIIRNFTSDPHSITMNATFAFDKDSKVIRVTFSKFGSNKITLRGSLGEVLNQVQRLVDALISESSSSLSFIKGIRRTESGYNLFVGYRAADDIRHTLNVLVSASPNERFVALQVMKNSELVNEIARATVKVVNGRLAQLRLTANPVLVNFVQKAILDISTEANGKINSIANNIIIFLELLKDLVTENEAMQQRYNAQIDVVIGIVEEARILCTQRVDSMASDAECRFNLADSATERRIRESIKKLEALVDKARTLVLRPFIDVYDQYVSSILNDLNDVVIEQLEPVIVVLKKANAGQLLIDLVNEALGNTFDYVMTNGDILFVAARKPLSEFLYVDSSTIIFNIPLAVEITDIQSPPSFDQIKVWFARSTFAAAVNDAIAKVYSYADDYYRARALVFIPRNEVLPPFKGHAFVSGFRHFSTFDKKSFDLTSDCESSHVLAADMRDNNFTIAVSYGRSKNAIEVIVGDRHVIVLEDYVVKEHKKNRELPLVLETMSIVREGNVIHVRRTEGDLDVACDFTKSLCTVDISPYYFGATAGLAGIYNNEPMDDFTSPRHNILDTSEDLARAWESSRSKCFSTNTAQSCTREFTPCQQLYNRTDSPLRPCFPLVDPKPFMSMCKDDMCRDTGLLCNSIHAYAYRCSLLGARIELPSECVSCMTTQERSTFASGTNRNDDVNGLDVVLVVEQGACMKKPNIKKLLKKFLKKFEIVMKQKRIRDIRYQLVGYGGIGASAAPNTITVRNQPFATSKKLLLKALSNIPLSTERIHADTLGAIYYATQLPFRAGAEPMIIVLPCDTCHDSEVSYSDVEGQLRKRNIQLHYMSKRQITAGRSSKSMFGFDERFAYSKGRRVERNVLKPNKNDTCEVLSTGTGGSVWDATLLGQTPFINQFTDYLSSDITQNQPLRCVCELNKAGIPSSVCEKITPQPDIITEV